jgi:cysteine desulfurase
VAAIYLDYAATTPVDGQVAARMQPWLGTHFGNAASAHGYGAEAARAIEAARAATAALIGAPPRDLVFTSGATEANNLALFGLARGAAARGRHIVTSAVEHKSVLDPARRLERAGFQVQCLRPTRAGTVDPDLLRAALRPDTTLVSLMHANNEIGVINDLAACGAVCRERGVPLHVDAAQSAGKLAIDVAAMNIDLLSLSAHKFHGPQGVGALYVRQSLRAVLEPLQFGGGQERGLRSGTLPVHQIVGLGAAAELAQALRPSEAARIANLRDRLQAGIAALPGVVVNGGDAARVPGILNVSFAGVNGESLVAGLAELALSTSAACNADSDETSYVLRALGRDAELAQASLRLSLGRFTTEPDIDAAIAAVCREVPRLRALAETPLPGGEGWSSGRAGARALGTEIGWALRWLGDTLAEIRYAAYGGADTLRACAWLGAKLRGRPRQDAQPGGPLDWARELNIPDCRLGELLVVEDALRAALAEGGTGDKMLGAARP